MRRAAALLALALAGCEPSAAADAAAPDSLQPLLQAYVRAAKPGETQATYQEMFDVVLRRVRRDYAGEIETANLVAAGIKAIEGLAPESESPAEVFKRAVNAALASLDPYSNYLDAGDLARLRSAIAGSFGGIGLEVDMVEGLVRAVAPIEDSPAARAGLKTGDLIVRIGDLPVLGLTLADAVSRLRGEPGTQVAIAIRRPGREDEFIVTLTREMIRSPVARARMEDDILVLRVSGFARSLKPMLEKAVADAQRERAPRGVIMDLRGNPGGTLDQAVVAADAFLTAGEIVSIRGRAASETRRWKADEAEVLAGVPMVVLIDGGSASASEIVAGALQDHGRATIMGRRSYGKGSVQTVIPLGGDKGALRLTTALYYTPSGRVVQRAGIGPDIELVPPDDAAQPRGGRREGDDARALPGAVEPPPPRHRIAQAQCPRPAQGEDRALGCALAFLRAGGIDGLMSALEAPAK